MTCIFLRSRRLTKRCHPSIFCISSLIVEVVVYLIHNFQNVVQITCLGRLVARRRSSHRHISRPCSVMPDITAWTCRYVVHLSLPDHYLSLALFKSICCSSHRWHWTSCAYSFISSFWSERANFNVLLSTIISVFYSKNVKIFFTRYFAENVVIKRVICTIMLALDRLIIEEYGAF